MAAGRCNAEMAESTVLRAGISTSKSSASAGTFRCFQWISTGSLLYALIHVSRIRFHMLSPDSLASGRCATTAFSNAQVFCSTSYHAVLWLLTSNSAADMAFECFESIANASGTLRITRIAPADRALHSRSCVHAGHARTPLCRRVTRKLWIAPVIRRSRPLGKNRRLGATSAFPPSHQSRRFAVAAVKRPAPIYLSEGSGVLVLNRRLRHAGQVQVRRSACL